MEFSKEVVVAGTVGVVIGAAAVFAVTALTRPTSSRDKGKDSESEYDDEEEGSELESEEGDTIAFDPNSEYKIVFLVRQDLKMNKGKIAAQCSHATLAAYKKALRRSPEALERWEAYGQPKIVLKCPDMQELQVIRDGCSAAGIPTSVIHDAGRTQVAAGSLTVMAVGPAPKDLIDQYCGHLKLY